MALCVVNNVCVLQYIRNNNIIIREYTKRSVNPRGLSQMCFPKNLITTKRNDCYGLYGSGYTREESSLNSPFSPSRNLSSLTNTYLRRSFSDELTPINVLTLKTPCMVLATRNKSKGKSGKRGTRGQEEFSDDDESEDDDMELESGKDFRDIKARVPSLRMDAILKAGLGMSRNKVEAAFYGSKIRVNGSKILKKSKQLHEGDEVDVVKGPSSVNPDFLNISRVVIVKVGKYEEDSDKVSVKLRKYSQLLVDKYEDYARDDEMV
ncbi:mitochondrial transcription rescue factor 1-like [Homarus americanus]|uniref:Mitochondrial transcription rescue factor 1-like n=1 Tax=Homarus americanus TaxID=6706 RepID=A0A8J5N1G1_HOMAM|nr:mitochondrial transcription rescue factor 1-like [Homarus americanus]KAG7171456.1 Mitochondrial transcription rescue factor 1-like [Homarus americanus]